MSYRDTLVRLREDLVDTDRALAACELQVPSIDGRIRLGRAQGFVRAAQQLITQALQTPVDGAQPRSAPVTVESRR